MDQSQDPNQQVGGINPEPQPEPTPQTTSPHIHQEMANLKPQNIDHIPHGNDMVRKVLAQAVQYEASDIYVVVNYYPSLKVGGKIYFLTEGFSILTAKDVENFINSIMNEKQQAEYKEQLELDFAYTDDPTGGRFRVNVFTQMRNPSCALRYLRSEIPSIDSLGLPEICKSLAQKSSGIILLAGPTGSGKSTTLSAMVDFVNSNFVKHIITIEDPVEYLHPLKKSVIEQREVGSDTHSFGKAMKSALRQNPQVLVLGEMRDLESISSAITIAETGHLVFSTIHARSSAQTINKIIDSYPPEQQSQVRQQLSESLLAVISQQLIPAVDQKGQELAMEIMVVNSAISHLIREGQSHQIESIIQTSKKEGMQLLDLDLERLLQEGKITVDDAIIHSNSPDSLRQKLISSGVVE